MSNPKYVIVGSEVDQAEYFLHPDGSIDRQKGQDGTALNVEYIGQLMVDLSKRGPGNVTVAELETFEDQVRHALMVQDFALHSGGAELSDDERAAILENCEVRIEFETRMRGDRGSDRNRRILVVPSDETLEITDTLLKSQGSANGFRPPLSYELDRALMLASMQDDILQMVREFAAAERDMSAEMQQKLEDHIKASIADRCTFKDAGGNPADDVKNDIMKSPLRSFYRSVGIYATNMCR